MIDKVSVRNRPGKVSEFSFHGQFGGRSDLLEVPVWSDPSLRSGIQLRWEQLPQCEAVFSSELKPCTLDDTFRRRNGWFSFFQIQLWIWSRVPNTDQGHCLILTQSAYKWACSMVLSHHLRLLRLGQQITVGLPWVKHMLYTYLVTITCLVEEIAVQHTSLRNNSGKENVRKCTDCSLSYRLVKKLVSEKSEWVPSSILQPAEGDSNNIIKNSNAGNRGNVLLVFKISSVCVCTSAEKGSNKKYTSYIKVFILSVCLCCSLWWHSWASLKFGALGVRASWAQQPTSV